MIGKEKLQRVLLDAVRFHDEWRTRCGKNASEFNGDLVWKAIDRAHITNSHDRAEAFAKIWGSRHRWPERVA